ncbi:hypothetical protein PoB_006817000 [Plakobranchus ocellatus]|uniref:Uncharacterized protein n=1 Tax=Plakobranchus ocellatus TaxID=259542 RepID=A0AAV4DC51_9GAST|nr:hypothetical protein PoB_006817000 [Plakobranchus ocellatus]
MSPISLSVCRADGEARGEQHDGTAADPPGLIGCKADCGQGDARSLMVATVTTRRTPTEISDPACPTIDFRLGWTMVKTDRSESKEDDDLTGLTSA